MMYTPKFLSLDGAAHLIADRLKAEDSQAFVDDQAALESARRQLLAALYEGAVRAEGVWWEVPGENEEPEVQYDTWDLIPQGLWSHARYDEDSDGEAVRLDTIGLGWTTSSFSIYDTQGSLTETEIHNIRVCRADIDREFPISEEIKEPEATASERPIYRTGVAGRPTGCARNTQRLLGQQQRPSRTISGINSGSSRPR
jgi:hypothetical protein